MTRYIGYRVLGAVAAIWLATTLTFFAMHLVPGDPAEAALSQSTASQDVLERRRADLGLDQPIMVQYGRYLEGILRGQLGLSWSASQPVEFLIAQQLRPTAALALAGTAVAILVGFGLGIAAGVGQANLVGVLARGAAGFLLSLPVMFSGMLLIALFAVQLKLFPATGQGSLSHLILPALVVGLSGAGGLARTVESGIREMLSRPFLQLAYAKGLSRTRTIVAHALRVGLLPSLDAVALQIGFLLGGAVITEAVFSRQGIGRLLLQAVLNKDLPVVQGIVILSVVVYSVLNLCADIAHAVLDPRLRVSSQSQ